MSSANEEAVVPAERLTALSNKWIKNKQGPKTVLEMTETRPDSLPPTPTACLRTEGSRKAAIHMRNSGLESSFLAVFRSCGGTPSGPGEEEAFRSMQAASISA